MNESPIFMSIKEFLSIFIYNPHIYPLSQTIQLYVISTPKERKKVFFFFFKKKRKENKKKRKKKKRELYGSSIYTFYHICLVNKSIKPLSLTWWGCGFRSGFWLVLVSIPCFPEREAPVVYKSGSEGSLDFQWTGLVGTFHNP